MKRITIIFALLLGLPALLPAVSMAQQEGIIYTKLAPGITGIGSMATYGLDSTNANVDSVWTALPTSHSIGSDDVYLAQKISGATKSDIQSGRYTTLATYTRSEDSRWPYRIAGAFANSSVSSSLAQFNVTVAPSPIPSAVFRFEAAREVTDTGLIAIGTPTGGTFVVTGILIIGSNDTSGYASNAVTKVGTAAGGYSDLCASAAPPLGAACTLSATLVSPRVVIATGTTIYWHVTTAAVATTEHAKIIVTGSFE